MSARSCAAISFCGVLRRSTYSTTLATPLAPRSLPCTSSSFSRLCLCRLPPARVLLLQEDRASVLVQAPRPDAAPRVADGFFEEPHAPLPQQLVGRVDVVRAQDRKSVV